jgi:hypothetical protein
MEVHVKTQKVVIFASVIPDGQVGTVLMISTSVIQVVRVKTMGNAITQKEDMHAFVIPDGRVRIVRMISMSVSTLHCVKTMELVIT